ncbi:carbamoyltransferase C-terminal domain-containing protein [Mycobacterium lepromatosis]|uniref:carbamoyltransferase C-terminal domain-containing protein n=1 Tax=Mycobacterium lepromatosis TaxID=480418 RepID=UPI0009E5DE26|nr:carbamoyltransferase C-terminal domain-containing protein [Mycobacterium lepromatosis]
MCGRGQVLGWFQGRIEPGPRALGQRSIFVLPAIAGHCDHVNNSKRREKWPLFALALPHGESR